MSTLQQLKEPPLRLVNGSISLERLRRLTRGIKLSQELVKFRLRYRCKQPLSLAITQPNYPQVEEFLRLSVQLIFLARMDMLLAEPSSCELRRCQIKLREEYLKLYFGYPRDKHLSFSILTVVIGCLVVGALQQIIPELDISERLRMDVLHILINVTLGVFIGDAAVRALTSKFVEQLPAKKPVKTESNEHIVLSRIVSRYSTDSSAASSELTENWIREIRKILRVQPLALPPLAHKRLEDQSSFQQEANNLDKDQVEHKLKGYKLYSSQLSSSMAEIRGEHNGFLPYVRPVKLSVHLQCTSLHYTRKQLPKKAQPKPQVVPTPKREPIRKDTLSYWRNKLEKLKELNTPSRVEKQIETDCSDEEEQEETAGVRTKRNENENVSRKQTALLDKTSRNSPNNCSQTCEVLKSMSNITDAKKTTQPQNFKLASLVQSKSISLNQEVVKNVEEVTPSNWMPNRKQHRKCKVKQLRHARLDFQRSCISNRLDLDGDQSEDCQLIR